MIDARVDGLREEIRGKFPYNLRECGSTEKIRRGACPAPPSRAFPPGKGIVQGHPEVRERHREAIRVLKEDWVSFCRYARESAALILQSTQST